MPTALVLTPSPSGKRLPASVYVDRLVEARELRGPVSRPGGAVPGGAGRSQRRGEERVAEMAEVAEIGRLTRRKEELGCR